MRVRIPDVLLRFMAILSLSSMLVVGALTTVVASPVAAGVEVVVASAVAASSGVDVYVGYVDTQRPDPANFPTPWAGDSGVIYEGCSPVFGCDYDGGAVRVVNNSSSPVTVNSVVIHYDTCTYDIWPHSVSLPAGNQLIVTQTVSGAAAGCTPGNGQMDSSDIGPGASNWAGNCNQSGITPQVDVTIDETTSSFSDTGQVLNTGGVDKASCPAGTSNNESTQWTLVGSQPCAGSSLDLAPSSQTDPVGTTAMVKATFTNDCGTPLQGATVNFAVPSGPNAGATGSAITDSSGIASFSYTSAVTGSDTVHASITNLAGTINSNDVTVDWTKDKTALLYRPDHPGLQRSGHRLRQSGE